MGLVEQIQRSQGSNDSSEMLEQNKPGALSMKTQGSSNTTVSYFSSANLHVNIQLLTKCAVYRRDLSLL